MPTLILRFPGRRYHATPWGHHVNEGLVEWPPSPWRMLRALLSTGYTALGWPGAVDDPMTSSPPPEARSLIEALASVSPSFILPAAAGGHTRHYMPLGKLQKGRESTTLVFDTWVDVGNGELAVTWDCEVTSGEADLLGRLAENLGYLGRAESRVEGRLQPAGEASPAGSPCVPCTHERVHGPGWEQIALIAPISAPEYADWRGPEVAKALAPFPPAPKKPSAKLRKQREAAQAPYPRDLIACLQADVAWLRSHGWSQPPGSRRVLYWRRTDALETGAPRPRLRPTVARPTTAILLAMTTESGNDHALPSTTRTLPQAELLHRALVGSAQRAGGHSAVLSGCDEGGRPSTQNHDHAHVLPLDLDQDGHLEHVLIWAPRGLDGEAQAAVRGVRRTFTKGGVGAIKLAMVASGDIEDLRRYPGLLGDRLAAVLGPPGGAVVWTSLTPFVAPRHVKARGRNTLAGQIASELETRGLPPVVEIRILPLDSQSGHHRFRHYIRQRRRGPLPPVDCCFRVEVRLAAPSLGPVALGYGSHFGLGLFRVAGNP